jgi:putative phosphoesterase
MRLALFSDQHGNDMAFRAVVEDVRRIGADALVCLGDAIQGGAQPAETLERLMALDCPTVLGNADAFLFGADVAEETTPEQAEVRDWTLEQIGDAGLERLRHFQPTVKLELEGQTVLCCHGSPRSYDDILLPEDQTELDAWMVDADLLAGGHTHRQWTRRIGEALFVNPGSVGLAYDHHRPRDEIRFVPVAEYALVFLDAGGPAVEFRRVGYDFEELREAVLASGRPYRDEHLAMYER